MAALLLLVLLLALSAASLTGRTADSRDPQYGMGPLLHHRTRARS